MQPPRPHCYLGWANRAVESSRHGASDTQTKQVWLTPIASDTSPRNCIKVVVVLVKYLTGRLLYSSLHRTSSLLAASKPHLQHHSLRPWIATPPIQTNVQHSSRPCRHGPSSNHHSCRPRAMLHLQDEQHHWCWQVRVVQAATDRGTLKGSSGKEGLKVLT